MCTSVFWAMRVCILIIIPFAVCDVARQVIDAIQESRLKYNLNKLTVVDSMNEIARDRAEILAGSSELENKTELLWELAQKHGYKPIAMGENIGKSVNKEKEGIDIFEEWIKSETHRENIVNAPEYTHLGVYKLKTESGIYLSAIFGQESAEDARKTEKALPQKASYGASNNNGLMVTSTRSTPAPAQKNAPLPMQRQNSMGLMPGISDMRSPLKPVMPQDNKSNKKAYSVVELVYPRMTRLTQDSSQNPPIKFILESEDGKKIQEIEVPETSAQEQTQQAQGSQPQTQQPQGPHILGEGQQVMPGEQPGAINPRTVNFTSPMPHPSPPTPDMLKTQNAQENGSNPSPQKQTIIKLIMVQPGQNNTQSMGAQLSASSA
ncbi:uncharacterized protein NEPG_01805 [Nematocida parisii ERTm1]|uniref:uncharacterized protein n=1 Tax=Nematocida parisii (strain ERTm1 / ATCC PRA-289) TaxID=881290 RepID=UPI000264B3EC|nr:uncharacterized protein NEPG_01805 [Nematocida parisii ERTm1]EIJ93463.1 hypothetical protein NEPG_01805 [Nematocida parisii ERTm1]|eukprot:XP_013059633.1 hypothetical protein NEPG_01805 [Nematocida parisii ERTm1]